MRDRLVLRFRALNIAHTLLGAVTAALGASGVIVAIDERSMPAALIGAPLVCAGSLLAVRSWRACVLLGIDHVEIRGIFRTHRIPRDVVRSVSVEQSASFIPWRSLAINTEDRGTVVVKELSSIDRSSESAVDKAVVSISSWLAA
jgi:Bacterial PH domain